MDLPAIGEIVHYMPMDRSMFGDPKPDPWPATVLAIEDIETAELELEIDSPNGKYKGFFPYSEELKYGHWSFAD